ncbi:nuclear transport factor 2 family protein [Jiangella endophytica]|uniref:nuclear transport factor 2 family protein n=1 Tax=Jiangella endophytica TaxID=1623398 RepID=UPI0038CC1CEE
MPAARVRRVADEYVTLMRAGRLDEVAALLAPNVVRVAPMETGGDPVERRGTAEIVENADRLLADIELHAVTVDGPFPADGRFAARFRFDQTHTPTGTRSSTTKLSLYTVADGLIVREEVFYYDAPQASTG